MIKLKEHGIYRRRDGKIVGPAKPYYVNKVYPWLVESSPAGQEVYTECGEYSVGRKEHSLDLIKEIIVGEGWRPWAEGMTLDLTRRVQYATGPGVTWNDAVPADLQPLAFRYIEPAFQEITHGPLAGMHASPPPKIDYAGDDPARIGKLENQIKSLKGTIKKKQEVIAVQAETIISMSIKIAKDRADRRGGRGYFARLFDAILGID